MIYIFGFVGFCFGFYAGLMIIKARLRDKSKEELVTDKTLHKKYGWIVWVTALFGCWLGTQVYPIFF